MNQRSFVSVLTATLFLVTGCHSAPPRPQDNVRPQDLSGQPKATLEKALGAQVYHIVAENGTERPFSHPYNKNKAAGIYVDVVSGEALFASIHKFDSGTGWPSFWQPIDKQAVIEKSDYDHGMTRVEVRGKKGDTHLGHVFQNGPRPTGLRYCINGLALVFIEKEKMKELGYEKYLSLFGNSESAK